MAENDDADEAPRRRLRERDDHDHRGHRERKIKFWTIAQVADRLQVSTRTVRRWVDNDELVAHRIGGIVRIAESDLQAFLARYREG